MLLSLLQAMAIVSNQLTLTKRPQSFRLKCAFSLKRSSAPCNAPGIAMVTLADIENCTGPTHVGLVGALAGERYCFPGVGKPPDLTSWSQCRSFQRKES